MKLQRRMVAAGKTADTRHTHLHGSTAPRTYTNVIPELTNRVPLVARNPLLKRSEVDFMN
jgi:hypothetical protein